MNCRIQEVTITKVTHRGSSMVRYNVDRDGAPFGQIWTFQDVAWKTHLYHVKTLAGFYTTEKTYDAAERAIRGQM